MYVLDYFTIVLNTVCCIRLLLIVEYVLLKVIKVNLLHFDLHYSNIVTWAIACLCYALLCLIHLLCFFSCVVTLYYR